MRSIDAAPPQHLRIDFLGPPRLVLPNSKPHFLERRDAAMLALLALNGPTPRSRVVALLWPDLPTRTAQTNLRQRLFRLKQRVGREIILPDTVMALATDVRHDLEPHEEPPEIAIAARDAPLLGELDYGVGALAEWVAGARARWNDERRRRLAQTAANLESAGRIAEAIGFAEQLIAEAPTAEHAHRRLMRLHYRRGDRAAALAAYSHCRELLGQELGMRPSDETRELAALIERSGVLPLPQPVSTPSPVATWRPPRLVGREPRWQAMAAAWHDGTPIVIRGEPGIGKSRLVVDFATAQNETVVHRAHPGDTRMPYTLLARVLRQLIDRHGVPGEAWVTTELARVLPELGPAPAGSVDPLRLLRATAWWLADCHRQGLKALVVDDLQFADQASLELLLLWAPERAGLRLIATVRAGEVPAALDEWLNRQGAAGTCDIRLDALDEPAIGALLDSLGIAGLDATDCAAPLARYTGGNPMFVLETIRAQATSGAKPLTRLQLTAPPHIGKLLDVRIARLPLEALRLVRVAALSGPDFSIELAAEVLGVHVLDLAEAWTACADAQIIRAGAFAHDLLLEAAVRSVPGPIARPLHRAIAAALERATAPAGRIAYHWQLATEWHRAAVEFERAAKAAVAASRPHEETAYWDEAHRCAALAGNRRDEFRLRCIAAKAAISSHPMDEAVRRTDALLAEAVTDTEHLYAHIAKAMQLTVVGDFAGSVPLSEKALQIARHCSDARAEFWAVNLHGIGLIQTGRIADSLALFEQFADRVDAANDPGVGAEFAHAFGFALRTVGRTREAAHWFGRAAAVGEAMNDLNFQAINLGHATACLADLGALAPACAHAELAAAVRDRIPGDGGIARASTQIMLAQCRLNDGRYAEALELATAALEQFHRDKSEVRAVHAEHLIATLYRRLGQFARAKRMLSARAAPLPAGASIARRLIIGCQLDSAVGRCMVERLRTGIAELAADTVAGDRFAAEWTLAVVLPAAESLALSRELLTRAERTDQPAHALGARLVEADALRRLGRHAESADAARRVVEASASVAWQEIDPPWFWWMVHQALHAGGCETEATAALRNAADWIEAALPHVPQAFRESFLHRSPVAPQVIAAARRLAP